MSPRSTRNSSLKWLILQSRRTAGRRSQEDGYLHWRSFWALLPSGFSFGAGSKSRLT